MRKQLYLFLITIFILVNACRQATEGNTGDGAAIFKKYCVNCHGIDGSLMTNGAKDLRFSTLDLQERILVITEGRNVMTPFKRSLTKQQIRSVANYTFHLADSIKHVR